MKQTYGVDLRGLARKAAGGGVTTSSRGRMPSLVKRNQASSEAIALQMMDKEWAAGVHCFKCFGHFRCLGMVILSTNFIPALAEILYWNFRLPASHRALGDCDIICRTPSHFEMCDTQGIRPRMPCVSRCAPIVYTIVGVSMKAIA